jgi:putative sigma-54 modulation protein
MVEVKIHVPKELFVVKKRCKTFEEAVDSACSSLERKLVKKKEKPRVQTSLKFL